MNASDLKTFVGFKVKIQNGLLLSHLNRTTEFLFNMFASATNRSVTKSAYAKFAV